MWSASNGNYIVPITPAVANSIRISIPRVLALQRTTQGAALACALGWHADRHDSSRCSAQGFADILHVPQEEWT